MTFLTFLTFAGAYAYSRQFALGLSITGMTNQVSWGLYIANFTFIVGLAAAAVMLVIPAYVYRNKALQDVVILGELLASMLSWDVVVLLGYLVLNVHICGYLLYIHYLGEKPNPLVYIPFVFIAIFWAISIHTVTAFLYVGLSGRPFWNAAIVAPRFIGSAFTAGPGFMFITFQVIRHYTRYKISDEALQLLRQIITISLMINLFMVGCEAFKEFAISMESIAAVIFIVPALSRKMAFLNIACIMSIWGIWIEKRPYSPG